MRTRDTSLPIASLWLCIYYIFHSTMSHVSEIWHFPRSTFARPLPCDSTGERERERGKKYPKNVCAEFFVQSNKKKNLFYFRRHYTDDIHE